MKEWCHIGYRRTERIPVRWRLLTLKRDNHRIRLPLRASGIILVTSGDKGAPLVDLKKQGERHWSSKLYRRRRKKTARRKIKRSQNIRAKRHSPIELPSRCRMNFFYTPNEEMIKNFTKNKTEINVTRKRLLRRVLLWHPKLELEKSM